MVWSKWIHKKVEDISNFEKLEGKFWGLYDQLVVSEKFYQNHVMKNLFNCALKQL